MHKTIVWAERLSVTAGGPFDQVGVNLPDGESVNSMVAVAVLVDQLTLARVGESFDATNERVQ